MDHVRICPVVNTDGEILKGFLVEIWRDDRMDCASIVNTMEGVLALLELYNKEGYFLV